MNVEGDVVDQIKRKFEERSGLIGIQNRIPRARRQQCIVPESLKSERTALRDFGTSPKRLCDRRFRCTFGYVA